MNDVLVGCQYRFQIDDISVDLHDDGLIELVQKARPPQAFEQQTLDHPILHVILPGLLEFDPVDFYHPFIEH
jgi:hypothetical protein